MQRYFGCSTWLLIQGEPKSGAPTVVSIPLVNPVTASALSFDRIADLYDRVRCGYPDQLFDDIVTFTGSSSLKRALEIGCASGQATKPFATRGFQIICVEPGPNFARLARQNLAEYKNVEVVCASFEDWTGNPQTFDLVFSANAIHWVDREIRVQKTAQILRPGGTLAIFETFPFKIIQPLKERFVSLSAARRRRTKNPKDGRERTKCANLVSSTRSKKRATKLP